MPKSEDFQKIHSEFIKKYGKEKGDKVYYSWLNKHKLDDKKAMPKHLKAEIEMKKTKPFDVSYFANFSGIEFVAEDREIAGQPVKVEKVILSGILLDSEPNENSWKAHVPSMSAYAESISRAAVKVQHGNDDWKIIGSGLEGVFNSDTNTISYRLEIANPEAVAKFKTGEWNEKTMGVSPKISHFTKAECNVCNSDQRICGHKMGLTYEGKKCILTPVGGYVKEISLTSEPAYFPRAGTIDYVSFAASLMEQLNINTEESNMDDLAPVIEAKETEIKSLSAKLEVEGKEKETFKAKVDELTSKVAAFEATVKEKEALATELSKLKMEARRAELAKLVEDEKIVDKIVAKSMTDDEFKAEIELIGSLKVPVSVGGSAPIEGGQKLTPEQEFKAEWGCTQEEYIKELIGG